MAWTVPMTWVTGTVITAAQLNQQLRDNLMETLPASAPASGRWPCVDHKNKIVWRNPKISMEGMDPVGARGIRGDDYGSPGKAADGTGSFDPGPTVVVRTAGALFVAWSAQMTPATASQTCFAAPQFTQARPDDDSNDSEFEEGVTVREIDASDKNALIVNGSMADETFAASHHMMVHGLTEDSGEAEVRIQLLYRRGGTDVCNVRYRRLFVWPMS